MTQAAHRARQLFDLGVLSLGIPVDGQDPVNDRAQAARAFTRASQWDPAMADAWLGRIESLPGWKHPYDLMPPARPESRKG